MRRQCRLNDLPWGPFDKRVALLQSGSLPLWVRRRPLSQTPKDLVERTCSPFSENELEDPPLDRKRPRRVFSVQIPQSCRRRTLWRCRRRVLCRGRLPNKASVGCKSDRSLAGGWKRSNREPACGPPLPTIKRRGASPQDEKAFKRKGRFAAVPSSASESRTFQPFHLPPG